MATMARLGYPSLGEYGVPGRRFFADGDPPTHNVHMLVIGSPE